MQHLPLTMKGKISCWDDNTNYLQNKYAIIKDSDNFNVVVMNFGAYVQPPTGINDGSIDDYRCLDNIERSERCIYNDILIVISGSDNKHVFITIGGNVYEYNPNNKK
ncbi:DUF943 family protein [Serratia rubidaea]|nr:DUF943 family protein [Serratia rubidaea]MEB7585653.1 DUF943 family protein [Serratia rubidaea]